MQQPPKDQDILDLPALVTQLPENVRKKFDRIFDVSVAEGSLVPPPEMVPWIERQFGSLDFVTRQRIVKVTNKVVWEGTLYNDLRSRRPVQVTVDGDLRASIEETTGDPFCAPHIGTPADVFGRVSGRFSVSASNVAKYDGYHGVIVFDEHDPLKLSEERVLDYVDTALAWVRQVLRVDPEAKYIFIMWNCLWKSGASIVHGHIQVTATKGRHYAKVEWLRESSARYRDLHGSSYFDDLFEVHRELGIGWGWEGAKVFAYLAPIKEKEVFLLAPALDVRLKRALWRVLSGYLNLGVSSFNVAIYMPPAGPTEEDWSHFPVVIRVVDRGDPRNRTADVGAMELYASSVVSSDPFFLARNLRACF